MPLYEYKCNSCGEQFEVMQRFSDQPLTTHEACGGRVERLLSAPALQFKGSGWYITDYAKSGGGKPPGGEKSDTKKESKSESKSDSGSSSSSSSSSTPAPSTSSTDKK
jgi:putative FmdB family regulatory protein